MGKQQQVKDIPYHAREDSKPFTYGIPSALNGDTPISPSIHRRNWKQAASQQAASSELESPSLVRKLSSSDAPPGDFFLSRIPAQFQFWKFVAIRRLVVSMWTQKTFCSSV